jgi:hypothetical protein
MAKPKKSYDELVRRYENALHALKTGIEYKAGPQSSSPQITALDLRASAVTSDHLALVRLLVNKGLITELDYLEASAIHLEEEVRNLAKKLPEGVRLV